MTNRMTAAQFNAKKPAKPSKYRAKRTTQDGINFDSKKEAARWEQLKILERAGDIGGLERQVAFPLWGKIGPIMTDSGKRQRTYVADFRYVDWRIGGAIVVEDSKGMQTPEFKLKKAILAAQNITLLIT